MNRICIAALMTVMICASGCGPEAKKPTPGEALEATEKLLSTWDKDIKGSRADYIREQIRKGAEINAKDPDDGMTPLMFAAVSSTPEIVTLLLEKGADVNARVTGTMGNRGMTPLMLAAGSSSTPEIVTLLLAKGAETEARDMRGWTPLMLVSSPEKATLLLENGAEFEARNDLGQTPLMFAAGFSRSPEIVTLLLEKGAEIEARSIYGRTPLMMAVRSKTPEIITLLIDGGADVNAMDHDAWTPLKFATSPEIIQLLKDAGAYE